MLKPLFLLIPVLFFAALASEAANAQSPEIVAYECIAQVDDVGREEASHSAPLARWSDGRLRMSEKGGSYYTSENPNNPKQNWLYLFATQNGHGSSLIGFLQKKHFKCRRLP